MLLLDVLLQRFDKYFINGITDFSSRLHGANMEWF